MWYGFIDSLGDFGMPGKLIIGHEWIGLPNRLNSLFETGGIGLLNILDIHIIPKLRTFLHYKKNLHP